MKIQLQSKLKYFFAFFFATVFLTVVVCEEWEKVYLWENPEIVGVKIKERPSPKDDFASCVNFDWYNAAEIPPGYPFVNAFVEVAESLEDKVIALINEDDGSVESKLQRDYYNQALDYAEKFDVDVSPVNDVISQIFAAKSVGEIAELLMKDRVLLSINPFVILNVFDDMKEAEKYCCNIAPCVMTFDDSESFLDMTKENEQWLKAFSALMVDILKTCGLKSRDAKECFNDFIGLQIEMAKHKRPLADSARRDYMQSIYNSYSFEQIKNDFKNFPLADMLGARGLNQSVKYNIDEPDFIKGLDGLFTEENLEVIKGYLCCKCAQLLVDYGNAQHQKILKKHDKKLNCYTDYSKMDLEKFALRRVLDKFGNSIGKRYVEKYFSEELKKRIENITKTHIAIYRERLGKNDWLSETTKKLAIEKLDAMKVVVGMPENIPDTKSFFTEIGKDWLDTFLFIRTIEETKAIATILAMPYEKAFEDEGSYALEINADNTFTKNRIFIPAGILQPPFYEDGYGDEELLGGIGMVIGHEISHAFDAVGSQFDKYGKMANWWTEEDRTAFDALNDAVEDYYGRFIILLDEKMEDGGVSLDGARTLTENVADLGGLSCCLEQMKMLENPDYKKFFETYAKLWTMKAAPDIIASIIRTDPHSVSYIRVNVVVQQFQEFYDTYGVKEGDKMYLAPEKRLKVW